MQKNMETQIGWLLQAKIKEFNDKYQTDFEIVVTDDTGEEQDWLYNLKVGKYLFENEWDEQELFAYICGMMQGAWIGRNNGR